MAPFYNDYTLTKIRKKLKVQCGVENFKVKEKDCWYSLRFHITNNFNNVQRLKITRKTTNLSHMNE